MRDLATNILDIVAAERDRARAVQGARARALAALAASGAVLFPALSAALGAALHGGPIEPRLVAVFVVTIPVALACFAFFAGRIGIARSDIGPRRRILGAVQYLVAHLDADEPELRRIKEAMDDMRSAATARGLIGVDRN